MGLTGAMGDGARAAASVLVVEDEAGIRDVVTTALRHAGYAVVESGNGRDGLQLALDDEPDLLVLDVMLPHINGYDLCQRLRDLKRSTPVLFLTARTEAPDRIRGFVAGGDDYLTKPFDIDELLYRVAAILRRTISAPADALVTVFDLELDAAAHAVRRGGEAIELSPTEFGLLHYLMKNAGTVLSKSQILVNVWDDDYDGSDNVVELYIGYLRKKIDAGRDPLIHTQRGVGYVLRPAGN